MQTVICFVMGFTQDLDTLTGQEKLWRKARRLSSPDTLVMTPVPWNTDPSKLAAFIARQGDGEVPKVRFVGYSWGGGWQFPRLATQLMHRAIPVESAVLCDAVYRSPVFPSWFPFNPMSLMKTPRITIPTNVKELWYVYQRERSSKLQGHHFRSNGATRIHTGLQIDGVDHMGIDDHPNYHSLALQVIENGHS